MSSNNKTVVIAGYARTPMGNFQGALTAFSAPELGASAIRSAISRSGITVDQIDEVLMGCILTAGIGQAPARQAALLAGLPQHIGATTINKMCGSGMKAIMMGCDQIRSGSAEIVVAGGMESMSNAPYLLPKVRQGLKLGHGEILDHMFWDGLQDPTQQRLMGCFAEDCAAKFQFNRVHQDAYARQSLQRAKTAIAEGLFNQEITPVVGNAKSKAIEMTQDEHPLSVDEHKISQLKPAFRKDGTVTAANASSIADGAAAVVLMSESAAQRYGVQAQASIIAQHSFAQQPDWFTTAPIYAIDQLLEKTNMATEDVDLFEINEAFAVVVMAAMQTLEIPKEKVNIHGGACALGHPIGASGARIVVTLLAALQHYRLTRGLASLCIGGGEATALLLEI